MQEASCFATKQSIIYATKRDNVPQQTVKCSLKVSLKKTKKTQSFEMLLIVTQGQLANSLVLLLCISVFCGVGVGGYSRLGA